MKRALENHYLVGEFRGTASELNMHLEEFHDSRWELHTIIADKYKRNKKSNYLIILRTKYYATAE